MGLYSTLPQRGFITVFHGKGSNPFRLWDMHIKNGFITKFLDPELKTMVAELRGTNVSTTYMICPRDRQSLGINLPFMVMIVKNLCMYFNFEIAVRDDKGYKRKFRIANFQSCTHITSMATVMPICLANGWNQIQFNLNDFLRRAYNSQLIEVISLKINANIRLNRIYFAERLLSDDELPLEYRLFYPISKIKKQRVSTNQNAPGEVENIPTQSSAPKLDRQSSIKTQLSAKDLAPVGSGSRRDKMNGEVTTKKSEEIPRRQSRSSKESRLSTEVERRVSSVKSDTKIDDLNLTEVFKKTSENSVQDHAEESGETEIDAPGEPEIEKLSSPTMSQHDANTPGHLSHIEGEVIEETERNEANKTNESKTLVDTASSP